MSKTGLGIELGSTRIKAVLVDDAGKVLGTGGYDWENRYENGIWTYDLDEVLKGVSASLYDLFDNYSVDKIDSIGISAMMHGYITLDKDDKLLVPFRTWRNTITGSASEELTRAFNYNIPQRWSIAHLYQSVLNKEPHVSSVNYLTTLSGYVHYMLTGQKVMGIGDASGMFPIKISESDYDEDMIKTFDGILKDKGISLTKPSVRDILPKVLLAGENAGYLTEAGVKILDPKGKLSNIIKPSIPLCPPEGDAGTGMVATNAVRQRTGNVSAGTSIFGMVVLERDLSKVYPELDLVTTPDGSLVAMAHCNNCTSELNAWMGVFKEAFDLFGNGPSMGDIFSKLYEKSLEGDSDCGGVLAYNYLSGEHVTGFTEGRPMYIRRPDSAFNLSNFIRAEIYTCFGALKVGMDILTKKENVKLDEIMGHGGIFKTPKVAQSYLAAALDTDVTVMETAGEGGAFGIAVLAMYMIDSKNKSLPDYLSEVIFANEKKITLSPKKEDVEGFAKFIETYNRGLEIERAAVSNL